MKIQIAKSAGFCMGVRRAVELALDAANKNKGPICTFGPLIHNPQAIDLLEEKGICVIDTIPENGSGMVLIRAHGVPPDTREKLETAGFAVIDATCPRVIKVQAIINRHASEGYAAIIIGDRDHPEVIGLLGHARNRGYVADSIDALEKLPVFDKAVIVAQTTQNIRFFEAVKEWAARNHPQYKVYDTICGSTEKRQAEVSQLAKSVDAVIVVGGHSSGNTKRLYEVAQNSGKPAQHVETENELDFAALKSAQCIGVTAGASTPNWILKRVCSALEVLLSEKEQRWRQTARQVQRALLLTNIYVSVGAGALCYACIRLQGNKNFFPHVLISMLYVLSMHILNNLTGKKADQYNDPIRARFYKKNQPILIFFALTAGAAGLITAYTLGKIHFAVLLVMSILGLSYNLRFIPRHITAGNFSRIKDIPGSKTILIALAWGVVTAILPSLSTSGTFYTATVTTFAWSTGMVFVRSAFFDVLDMQGDRIVGKETIPLLLGEARALRLLKALLLFSMLMLILSSAYKILPNLGYVLTLCPLLIWAVLTAHERGFMKPGIHLEFLIESCFILAGLTTLFWTLLTG